jgi:hypothetical protein
MKKFMIVVLCIFFTGCCAHSDDDDKKLSFQEGDIVTHKINGMKGVVMDATTPEPYYRVRIFIKGRGFDENWTYSYELKEKVETEKTEEIEFKPKEF